MSLLQAGQEIGPYRIVEQIGEGGMATVYKAVHPVMNRFVAIKILPHQFAQSDEFIARFRREVRVIASLEHPHILPVYDSGSYENVPFLIMRYMESGTLKEQIKAGPLPLAQVDTILEQLAGAVQYAHDQGVIHRDIKPSNVLIDPQGAIFLTDFGIAKLVKETTEFSSSGSITGTPAYMSPEQAQGSAIDGRSDIYSLGIMLYEMITGQVPFEAETPMAIILKHLQAPMPLPSSIVPTLHPAIEEVLIKALARDPADRFATVDALYAAWLVARSAAVASTGEHEPTAPIRDDSSPLSRAENVEEETTLAFTRPRPFWNAGFVIPFVLVTMAGIWLLARSFQDPLNTHSAIMTPVPTSFRLVHIDITGTVPAVTAIPTPIASQIAATLPTPSQTPSTTPTSPAMPTVAPFADTQFGILVADFVRGGVEREPFREGADLAQTIYEDLRRSINRENMTSRISVRRVGSIRDELEAGAIGEQHGASLVIWGYVPTEDTGAEQAFVPAFTLLVNDERLIALDPLIFGVRISGQETLELSQTAAARATGVSAFVLSLVYLSSDQPGDFEQAVRMLDISIELAEMELGQLQEVDPRQDDIAYTLALFYATRGAAYAALNKEQMAFADYAAAQSYDPGSIRAAHGLGNYYFSRGDYEAAGAAYTTAQQLDPTRHQPYYGLAIVAYMTGAYTEAEYLLKQALERAAVSKIEFSAGHFTMGLTYLQLGQLESARAAFQAVVENDTSPVNLKALAQEYLGSDWLALPVPMLTVPAPSQPLGTVSPPTGTFVPPTTSPPTQLPPTPPAVLPTPSPAIPTIPPTPFPTAPPPTVMPPTPTAPSR